MNASSVSVRNRTNEDQCKLHSHASWNCYHCPTTWYRFLTESSLASLSPAIGRGRDSSLGVVWIWECLGFFFFESLKIDRKTCAKFKLYWKLLSQLLRWWHCKFSGQSVSFFLVLLMYNGTCDVSANFTKLENSSVYLAPTSYSLCILTHFQPMKIHWTPLQSMSWWW